MADALHLRAEDAEDLAVMSSCLQDALVPLSDMRYERETRRFVLAVNRFRWETHDPTASAEGRADAVFERVACGIVFEGVRQVRIHGIDQDKREQLLDLLAVLTGAAAAARLGPETDAMPMAHGSPGAWETVVLAFAGGGAIRLDTDAIRVRLDDFGEPWPTKYLPQHRLEPEEA